MGFRVGKSHGTGQMVRVEEKLWLTKDKDQLVPDGDGRAAFLFCTPGDQIAVEDAEKLGIVDGRLDEKAAEAAANKMAGARPNKGASTPAVVTVNRDDGTPFDPSAHKAEDVIEYLQTAEKHEALRVLEAEAEGKKRSTILTKRDEVEAREQGDVSGLQTP